MVLPPTLRRGAALAVAIAEHFLNARAWCLISTHHTSLKVYAANTPGVINAAVGFNEQTLAPTYELRQGVPGASAGINIARRLGLNSQIIDSARSRLNTQTKDIGLFLDQLHAQIEVDYPPNARRCVSGNRRLRGRRTGSKSKG